MATPTARAARHAPYVSLLLTLPAAFLYLVPSVATWLEFERAAVDAGQWWRLVTCHWTHWSLDHLFWDTLAFVVLGRACERASRTRFLACVTGSVLACSLAVWLLLPSIDAYRGLSGIDSALFVLLAVTLARDAVASGRRDERVAASALLCGFVVKTGFELVTGTTLFVDGATAGTVAVPLAHVVGAVLGAAAGCQREQGCGFLGAWCFRHQLLLSRLYLLLTKALRPNFCNQRSRSVKIACK